MSKFRVIAFTRQLHSLKVSIWLQVLTTSIWMQVSGGKLWMQLLTASIWMQVSGCKYLDASSGYKL